MDREKLINKFEKYLLVELGYLYNTFKSYRNSVNSYLDWLIDNKIQPKKVTLDQTYDFIAYRRERGDIDRTITGFKSAITHFNQAIGMKANPALLVNLAKCDRKTPTDIIDTEFLDAVYRDTKANTLVQKRDRCMLGMVLYLAVQRTELASLQLEHLDLDNGRLYVPATASTNERYIPLHPKQMHHLYNYIYDLRDKLLQDFRKETNQLFFSSGAGNDLNGALNRMLKRIKLECHYVRSFKQLKQSRMVMWVKEHGLREAQYLGGYKYVTSVQRYDFKSLDKLQKLLEFHHPMEKMAI